jgi:hypothetical protein
MEYIESKLYYFLLDEFHYSEKFGAHYYEIAKSYVSLLSNSVIKDYITSLDIFESNDYELFLNIVIKSNQVSQLFNAIRASEYYFNKNNIQNIANLEKYINDEPFTLISFYIDDHQISIFIENRNNVFKIYFMNSGDGLQYHKKKIDVNITSESIIASTLNETQFKYFLNFALLSKNIDMFYNTALLLAKTQNLYFFASVQIFFLLFEYFFLY